MKKKTTFLFLMIFIICSTAIMAQQVVRKTLTVPKADSGAVTIDGVMDEAAWSSAAHVDMITSTGTEIFANYYYREGLLEPDFDELYGRLLWEPGTLYVFMHLDEIVNDSTNLSWDGKWVGDQLFVSLSARLGEEMMGWYDGNIYRAPGGPYHFWILGDQVTLNGGDTSYIPEQFRGCYEDSLKAFDASNICDWAISIDTVTGVWDVEMAIYNPNVESQGALGFNVGGSVGSDQATSDFGDAYAYYTWQPNVPDAPFTDPYSGGDPGYYNLANSEHWAVLYFEPGTEDLLRAEIDVPYVAPGTITLDGLENETDWSTAASADLITATGTEIFANYYYRDGLLEPDFDELYAKMLYTEDTLYVFVKWDEIVNDSTDLSWNGKWVGDQLFVSLSNFIAVDMMGWYDGNSYAAPDGPYHYWILGNDVTLNGGDTSYVPEQYRECFNGSDSLVAFMASDYSRSAVTIDTTTGVWTIEMAIHNPHTAPQSKVAFNLGGSVGSDQATSEFGDAYAYFTWQPHIPDDPFGDPYGNGDPGFYNLANADHWAMLNYTSPVSAINPDGTGSSIPTDYVLDQNFPNPFNPSTNISFRLPKQSKITVAVYNVLGQLVTKLIDGRVYNAGTHKVQWNAENMPSGIYFYMLQTDNATLTKKMVLLK